MIFDIIKVFIL